MKALVLTISLFGLGHLKRTSLLLEKLSDRFEIDWLVSGFSDNLLPPAPNVRIVHFPKAPLFEAYAYQADPKLYRRTLNASIVEWVRFFEDFCKEEYAFFLTESFPISKTALDVQMGAMLSLFKKRNPRGRVYASSKGMPFAGREELTYEARLGNAELIQYSCELMKRYYDLVFLHADPKIYKLDEEGPLFPEVKRDILRYTGYVARIPTAPPKREKRILFSGGSGLGLGKLYGAGLEAAALMPDFQFRFLRGPYAPEINSSLKNVEFTNFVDDFQGLLLTSAAAVTQGGSTLVDLYATKTPALAHPSKESWDQKKFTEKFSRAGAVKILSDEDLEGNKLAERLMRLLVDPPSFETEIDIGGQEKTYRLILDDLERHG
ncbi:MAG: hypothetical protein KDK48_04250 [Chlamydiia bacterium]|nr:hypothetical protein [Chlamydiia bacterium]